MNNDLTDVAGLSVGCAADAAALTGVTVIVCDKPCVAACDVRGGGPGTRETDLLNPEMTVEKVDAIALAGGSAFGLEAASGVMAWLAERGRGFAVGPARVPIVPGAILFDLNNGGDKSAVATGLYRDLALVACDAIGGPVPLGSRGAGFGATTATLRGGHGSASANTGRYTVAALAAVNAAGSATIGDSARFWAAAYERDGEFGGLGLPGAMPPQALVARTKGMAAASTTLCVVATDAALTKVQARRLAVMAQDGLARALHPVHTPLDGDVVFALATGRIPLADPLVDLVAIGSEAAHCLARAVARGVHAADSSVGTAMPPAWKDKFG
ncbi:MAG: P1 family peptidase [Rhodobiaceae bacterium]|nr:P1 family peptidase [Rhodobiaceae bacterium]MCC0042076.1 P1 family peptidase [Rhodobiaceae bacterium]